MKYKYIPDTTKERAYIFDIDGTLADIGTRNPYDFDKVDEDTVVHNVRTILVDLMARGNHIILFTGRNEVCKDKTIRWLMDNQIPFSKLIMRSLGDTRKDWVMKQHMFESDIAPYYNVTGVFDDRDCVVKMWREIGLTCLQPNYGAF